MNCKRCMHTGEKLPGRVTESATENRFAFCRDHIDWANRLMKAAHEKGWRIGREKGVGFLDTWTNTLYANLVELYDRADGLIVKRCTGKIARDARDLALY